MMMLSRAHIILPQLRFICNPYATKRILPRGELSCLVWSLFVYTLYSQYYCILGLSQLAQLRALPNASIPRLGWGQVRMSTTRADSMCQRTAKQSFSVYFCRYSFIQAMSYSPQNKRIISNFNTLLQDEDYMNEQTLSAHEEFLKSTDE